MCNSIIIPPNASSIVKSMRDIGYTLNTAIADIIDNSIAANAKNIRIIFDESPLHVLIIDDGEGMSEIKLKEAMRFAYMDPSETRCTKDLGRFGLGLKTATFSQAQKLTVVTQKNSKITAACWDLKTICEQNEWRLDLLLPKDITLVQNHLSEIIPHGTIVLWENLDRLTTDAEHNFSRLLSELRDHLSLVFHKFLSDKDSKKISISVNGIDIRGEDPFLSSNSFTKKHPVEKMYVDNSLVTIQAHILPHHSHLSTAENKYIKDKSNLLNNQGFYVYRNNRLMVWADWFRLAKKSDKYKLARVEIHFDKEIDHLWEIDIKKSKAVPPTGIRQRLKEIINKMLDDSSKVQRVRINKSLGNEGSLWNRISQENKVVYGINRTHPIVTKIEESLDSEQIKLFNLLLKTISTTLPSESIYGDITESPKSLENTKQDKDAAYQDFLKFIDIFCSHETSEDDLYRTCINTKLFSGYESELKKWISKHYD